MRHTCIKIKRKIKSYNFLVKLHLAKMKLYLLCLLYRQECFSTKYTPPKISSYETTSATRIAYYFSYPHYWGYQWSHFPLKLFLPNTKRKMASDRFVKLSEALLWAGITSSSEEQGNVNMRKKTLQDLNFQGVPYKWRWTEQPLRKSFHLTTAVHDKVWAGSVYN